MCIAIGVPLCPLTCGRSCSYPLCRPIIILTEGWAAHRRDNVDIQVLQIFCTWQLQCRSPSLLSCRYLSIIAGKLRNFLDFISVCLSGRLLPPPPPPPPPPPLPSAVDLIGAISCTATSLCVQGSVCQPYAVKLADSKMGQRKREGGGGGGMHALAAVTVL